MLILSRNISQTLNLGDDITVKVLDVQGKQVRLGITAPDDTCILRSELVVSNYDALSADATETAS